jgi:LmbE family N-acetylglucosaminyl deacetylase
MSNQKIKDSFEEVFKDVKRVLVVLAHPDDAEIICGGLIARLTASERTVRFIVTTNGGKGVQDKEGISEEEFGNSRINEQLVAGEILGIKEKENFNLNIPDGEFESSLENIEKIVYHIREFKPELVITHNPEHYIINFNNSSNWVNHRDHRNTGQVVLDAMYPYSRDKNFFPEQLKKGLKSHTVNKLLIADSYTSDNILYFNIDNYLEQKKKAIQSHPSAINPEYADEYIEENRYGEGYYEPLRYIEIY